MWRQNGIILSLYTFLVITNQLDTNDIPYTIPTSTFNRRTYTIAETHNFHPESAEINLPVPIIGSEDHYAQDGTAGYRGIGMSYTNAIINQTTMKILHESPLCDLNFRCWSWDNSYKIPMYKIKGPTDSRVNAQIAYRMNVYGDRSQWARIEIKQVNQYPATAYIYDTNKFFDPTAILTQSPTTIPTEMPTTHPTYFPTFHPTYDPTFSPTKYPSYDPTVDPTYDPTMDPTIDPTTDPTYFPTFFPTTDPTYFPTFFPSESPTNTPSFSPITDSAENVQKQSTTLTSIVINTQQNERVQGNDNSLVLYVVVAILILCPLLLVIIIYYGKRRKNKKGNDLIKPSKTVVEMQTPLLSDVSSDSSSGRPTKGQLFDDDVVVVRIVNKTKDKSLDNEIVNVVNRTKDVFDEGNIANGKNENVGTVY